jgi:ribosomal-protein-alanine N-acetyltransferase
MILRDMNEADLDAVLRIEREVHGHPWTPGNFSDALRSKYECKVYASEAGEMLGYAVLMLAVDEAELLDIAIDAKHQRRGFGGNLLEELAVLARRANMRRMVLEVRASNEAAIGLYRRAGFADIGLRRDYYPAKDGREDAMLMGREL